MDIKTLRSKTQKGLKKELEDAQARLQELSFKTSTNQLKNVREIRQVKKTVARILTIMKQSQTDKTSDQTSTTEKTSA